LGELRDEWRSAFGSSSPVMLDVAHVMSRVLP
jgi:hypothetical protein